MIETPCSYSEWCRQCFALIADGGTWAVPRSGLIFTRRGEDLALTKIICVVPVPGYVKESRADYLAIRREFKKAGIRIYDETGVFEK
jgi:hypothetical protein